MKRPLALFCISLLTGMAAAFVFPRLPLLLAAAALCLGAAVYLLAAGRRARLAAAVLLVGFAGACFAGRSRIGREQAAAGALSGRRLEAEMVVTDCTRKTSFDCAVTARIVSEEQPFSVVFHAEESMTPGLRIRALLTVGAWDGSSLSAEAGDLRLTGLDGSPLHRQVRHLCDLLAQSVRSAIGGEEGSVAAAITFGSLSGLSGGTYDSFVLSGIVHTLVVSGLHVTILLHLLIGWLRHIRVPYSVTLAASVLVCLAMLIMTDLSVSVLRVSVMMLFTHFGGLFRRRADPLTSLSAAAAVIVLFDPTAVADRGFLMSFLATLALVWAYLAVLRRLPETFRRWPAALRTLVSSLLASLCASLFVAPVLVACSMELSAIGPLTNLVTVWVMPAVLLLSLLTALLYLYAPAFFLTPVVAGAARLVLRFVVWAARLCASAPFAAFDAADWPVRAAVAAAFGLFAAIILLKGRRRTAGALLALLLMAGCGWWLHTARAEPAMLLYCDGRRVMAVVTQDRQAAALVAEPYPSLLSRLDRLRVTRGYRFEAVGVFGGKDEAREQLFERFPCGTEGTLTALRGCELLADGALTVGGTAGAPLVLWRAGGETVLLCYGSEPIPEPLLGCTYIILCDGRPANVGLARGTILSPAGRGGDRELPTRDYATLRIRNGGIAIEEHR